jgi:hypothetical protein
MAAYTRETRCAVARCPHCSWTKAFFAVDALELRLRAAMEQVLHIVTTHTVGGLKP